MVYEEFGLFEKLSTYSKQTERDEHEVFTAKGDYCFCDSDGGCCDACLRSLYETNTCDCGRDCVGLIRCCTFRDCK